MRFWDASALVPLIAVEPTSDVAGTVLAEDPEITVWWGTPVECLSALARRERAGSMPPDEMRISLGELADLTRSWGEVGPSEGVRDAARRVIRAHALRAADAFQLAAALTAADGQPDTLSFVTLDDRLALAARREGFPVVGV